SWIDSEHIPETMNVAIENTNEYIAAHIAVANKLNKPIVIEEFGFPRDNHLYTLNSPTENRDHYYQNIFDHIVRSANEGTVLAGCNVFGLRGYGRRQHHFWQPWDDYVRDLSREEQGLTSVFSDESTVDLIKSYNERLKK